MIYCRKCGSRLKETSKFCDACGAKIIILEERNDTEKYKEKNKLRNERKEKMMEKHKDEKNPYVSAAIIALSIAFVLSIFPWNIIGKGIGMSLPMRIVVTIFALLADYHVIKAKQVNNLLFSKYGFRINAHTVKVVNGLAIFMTLISSYALLYY